MRTLFLIVCLSLGVLCFAEEAPENEAPGEKNSQVETITPAYRFMPGLIINVPHPIGGGVDVFTPNRDYSFGASLGMFGYTLKTGLDNGPLKLSTSHWELRGRWHPDRGAFYVGVALGKQKFGATATKEITYASLTTPVEVEVSISSLYFAPHIGWLWTWDSGFVLGVNMGWLFPLGPSAEVSTDAPDSAKATNEYRDFLKEVNTNADKYGRTSLPFLTFLHFGYLF